MVPGSTPPPEPNRAPGEPAAKRYRVGTLAYTRSALIQVMFWMLWGDFFFQLLESLPSLIPLQLRWEGASDVLIGFNGSLTSICMIIMSPIAAVQSDRRALVSESADLVFHLLLLLRAEGLSLADVTRELQSRHSAAD